MATPAGLAVAFAAIGFGVYALTRRTRRREPSPVGTHPPTAPPGPPAPPVPVPMPLPPTTTARVWFPLYRSDSIPLRTTRELRGWFQGPSERAFQVEQRLAADRASRTTSLGTTWAVEAGQVNEPNMTGLTPYAVYVTTTVGLPVPGTRREQIGFVWARLEDANSFLESLGQEWELRAWLGPLP